MDTLNTTLVLHYSSTLNTEEQAAAEAVKRVSDWVESVGGMVQTSWLAREIRRKWKSGTLETRKEIEDAFSKLEVEIAVSETSGEYSFVDGAIWAKRVLERELLGVVDTPTAKARGILPS